MEKEIENKGTCKSADTNISKVYLIEEKDCVFENGVLVRLKRKYGNNKREVALIDYNSECPQQ